jgi:peptidoglycan/LPS O-acetylase OafA/YrhL
MTSIIKSPDFQMSHQDNSITGLTFLRGIAAIMVAVFHFNSIIANFVDENLSSLIAKSYLLVDLFFIMSGLIMMHVYGKKFSNTVKIKDFLGFMKARFARVYPMHIFVLACFVLIFYTRGQVESTMQNPVAILSNLLMLNSFGLHPVQTWNAPAWSIGAEWWVYVLFPFLAYLLARYKKISTLLFLVSAMSLYIAIYYFLPRTSPSVTDFVTPPNLDVTYDYGFLRCLAGFLLGMLLHFTYITKYQIKLLSSDVVGFSSFLLLLLLLHFGISDLLVTGSFMLLIMAVTQNTGIIYRISQRKSLQFLGNISYSIYMVHWKVMFVFVVFFTKLGFEKKEGACLQVPFWIGLAVCLAYLLLLICIAALTHRFIEKPCRSFFRK